MPQNIENAFKSGILIIITVVRTRSDEIYTVTAALMQMLARS